MTTTRERIVEASAELFRRQGYTATGVKQIVTAARAPFGSIYHHFPGGKEQLGAEAIRRSRRPLRAADRGGVRPRPDLVGRRARVLRRRRRAPACRPATRTPARSRPSPWRSRAAARRCARHARRCSRAGSRPAFPGSRQAGLDAGDRARARDRDDQRARGGVRARPRDPQHRGTARCRRARRPQRARRVLGQCGTRPPPAPGSVAGPRGAAMPSTRIALRPSDSFSRPSVDETSRPVSSRTRSKR